MSEARNNFPLHIPSAFFPGAAITLTVLGFNLLGDAIRDIADPRLRGSQLTTTAPATQTARDSGPSSLLRTLRTLHEARIPDHTLILDRVSARAVALPHRAPM